MKLLNSIGIGILILTVPIALASIVMPSKREHMQTRIKHEMKYQDKLLGSAQELFNEKAATEDRLNEVIDSKFKSEVIVEDFQYLLEANITDEELDTAFAEYMDLKKYESGPRAVTWEDVTKPDNDNLYDIDKLISDAVKD